MTKKDYILIAECIKNTRGDMLYAFGYSESQLETTEMFASRLTSRLNQAFCADNNRFDDKKFSEAIGVEPR